MPAAEETAADTLDYSTNDAIKPEVSVIIPVHNRAELCRQAVDSAMAALDGLNGEIIVVDDESDDDLSAALSRTAALSTMRTLPAMPALSTMSTGSHANPESVSLTLHRISRSGMPGHVRNVGVGLAGGRYIAFLDSDDLWYPDKIRAELEELRKSGARMVHCRERWLRAGHEISQTRHRHQRSGDIFKDALVKCIVGPSTFVIENDLFKAAGGFREDMRVAEDYELALRLLAFEPISYVDYPLVEKRDHDGPQLSHMYSHIEGFRIRALGDVLADMLEARLGLDARGESDRGELGPGAPDRQECAALLEAIDLEAIDAVSSIHGEHSVGRCFPRTRWGTLNPAGVDRDRLEHAVHEYSRKCRIFANGAAKRGRDGDAAIHTQAAEMLESI